MEDVRRLADDLQWYLANMVVFGCFNRRNLIPTKGFNGGWFAIATSNSFLENRISINPTKTTGKGIPRPPGSRVYHFDCSKKNVSKRIENSQAADRGLGPITRIINPFFGVPVSPEQALLTMCCERVDTAKRPGWEFRVCTGKP